MTDLSPETVRAMWRQIDRQAQEIATLHAALQAAANDVTELLDCVPMWMTEGPPPPGSHWNVATSTTSQTTWQPYCTAKNDP